MAEDEQPFERLHMDNDYEGGEWIGGEFFFKSKRQKRQQTKEDQLYGVFAGDSDEEDGGGKGRRGRGGARGSKADYTQPVSFVSTGETVQPSKPEEPARAPEREAPAGVGAGLGAGLGAGASLGAGAGLGAAAGLGFGGAQPGLGSHGGLGFAPAATGAAGEVGIAADEGMGAAEVEEEEVLPTAFGQRIKKAAEERRRQAESESRAKMRQAQAVSGKATGDVGKFEAHTKGIGAKLLAKMGYVPGQGLGKNKQGIAKPIEAKLRPKGMGMGFGDYSESKNAPKMAGAKGAEAEQAPAAKEAPKKEQGMWKKRQASARVRREYRTADEVLSAAEEAAEGGAKPAQQPILDMRGPQARLVTNMEALDVKAYEDDGDTVPMPELQHNLRLVVDLAEAEIARLDGKLRQEKDTAVILGREQTRQQLELEEADQELEYLSTIMGEVETAAKLAATPDGSLPALHTIYARLKRAYPEQYVLYNIPGLAAAHVQPHLRAKLAGLRPLEEPAMGLDHLRGWRALLEGDHVKDAVFADAAAEDDPYCRLLAEIVMPQLRTAVTNQWQPRDPEPLLRWLEMWEPVLPAPTRDYILQHLVMPALQRAVDAWEPRLETIAIHTWLHPWLAWLGTQLRPLYQPIRFKLSKALEAWHPSDGSALTLLRPWHRVFDNAEWEAMMNRCIVPKLAFALDQLVINPAAQDMQPFHWFTAWANVLALKLSAQLMERGFFPKFMQVLDHWLATSQNYDEITRWYLGWKAAIPEALVDHERVRSGINSALDLMNRRMAGDSTPFVYMPAGMPTTAPQAAPGPVNYAPTSSANLGLRELLQSFAEENGVMFMPKPGRMWGAHQVYSFGGVSCVIEAAAGVLRAQISDRWTPVSMEGLLAEARKRGGA